MDDSLLLTVDRFSDNGKETLSNIILTENKHTLFSCVGLELPWKDNQHSISCIPVGNYDWIKVAKSVAIPYEHISILNVPNRSGVCIHIANYVRQLQGCIAVGSKHVDMDNDGLLDDEDSGKAYNVLMALLPQSGKLLIQNSILAQI